MSKELVNIYCQEYEPSGFISTNPDQPDALWIKPSTGQIYEYNEVTGGWDACPIPSHDHLMSAITGLVDALAGKADSFTGISGTRTIQGHTLTFTNGILTGYQAP